MTPQARRDRARRARPLGDDEDRPLKLKLVKPRRKQACKKQPAGVGGRGDGDAPDEAPESSVGAGSDE